MRNELSIVPGDDFNDTEIGPDIMDAYERVAVIDPSMVEVKVYNGSVTLSGSISSWSTRRKAHQIAQQTPGVRNVHDDLTVID